MVVGVTKMCGDWLKIDVNATLGRVGEHGMEVYEEPQTALVHFCLRCSKKRVREYDARDTRYPVVLGHYAARNGS